MSATLIAMTSRSEAAMAVRSRTALSGCAVIRFGQANISGTARFWQASHVAQVLFTDQEWEATLRAVRPALRPGGLLVFESRDPEKQAWLEWNRDHTYRCIVMPEVGPFETRTDRTGVDTSLVSFRVTFVFSSDGTVLTSDSTLLFRSRDELANSLGAGNLVVDEIRDAPDRPGPEFVVIAGVLRLSRSA